MSASGGADGDERNTGDCSLLPEPLDLETQIEFKQAIVTVARVLYNLNASLRKLYKDTWSTELDPTPRDSIRSLIVCFLINLFKYLGISLKGNIILTLS